MSCERNNFSKPQIMPKPGSIKVVKALYNYTAKCENELSFNKDDILYVFDRSDSQWWKARLGLKSGLILSSYVDGKFDEITNPLHEAARRGNLTFLQECISQKVSCTALDSMGNTPLYWASCSGHIECIKCLLNYSDAPLNAQNNFGDTALHVASAKNHLEAVQVLLEAGCETQLLNIKGETPEKIAGSQKIKNLLQLYSSNKKLKMYSKATFQEYDGNSD